MAWKHPLCDVSIGDEEQQAVGEVLRSGWLSQGPNVAEFEERFSRYLGVSHAVMVSSCTAALHIALKTLGVGPGDEVLTPSYTFVSTANSILYRGATPVFVDIAGPHDLNTDPEDLRGKISPQTKAIIVVHMAGYPCDMDRVLQIADEHGLPVVEDACHAIGARYQAKGLPSQGSPHQGRMAGTIGRVGCFSFFSNKNMTTGEGGMLVTDDEEIARQARLLRSHAMTRMSWEKAQATAMDYDVVDLGHNYRSTEIAAAIGLVQLGKLDGWNARRRELVLRYREALHGVDGLTLPFNDRIDDSSHHIFPVLVSDPAERCAVRQRLADAGVQTSVHYTPVHLMSHMKKDAPPCHLPQTEATAAREITLPLYPSMTDEAVVEIANSVRHALANRQPAEAAQ